MKSNREVFVSYSHADKPLVLPIVERLKLSIDGIWIDVWKLTAGAKFTRDIAAAMGRARAIVLFVSHASLKSGWVLQEYEAALALQLEGSLDLIIPVVLDDSPLPLFLKSTHALFLRNGILSVTTKLLDALAGEASVYEFERELRRYQGVPLELDGARAYQRKAHALSMARSTAENRMRSVYYSIKSAANYQQDDAVHLDMAGDLITRDFAEWKLIRTVEAALKGLPAAPFSRTADATRLVDAVYAHILRLAREDGYVFARRLDHHLANDLRIVFRSFTSASDRPWSLRPEAERLRLFPTPAPQPVRWIQSSSPTKSIVRVAIGDDHPITRYATRALIKEYGDRLEVVAEAADAREALRLLEAQAIDVMVMDFVLPGRSELNAAAILKKLSEIQRNQTGVLIFSGRPESEFAKSLLDQGARGYINKAAEPRELIDAIGVISMGRRYITPDVAEVLAWQLNQVAAVGAGSLDARESLVLGMLARGLMSHAAIAEAIGTTKQSVSRIHTRIMETLSIDTDADLTIYAFRNDLIARPADESPQQ